MLYSVKRALLKPYVLVQRKRHRYESPMGIKILEVYSYSPTIKRFFRDSANNPLPLDHVLDEHSVVMDVGGYIGDWAEDIQQRYNPVIHVFEAHPGFIKKLAGKFAGDDKVIACGTATPPSSFHRRGLDQAFTSHLQPKTFTRSPWKLCCAILVR